MTPLGLFFSCRSEILDTDIARKDTEIEMIKKVQEMSDAVLARTCETQSEHRIYAASEQGKLLDTETPQPAVDAHAAAARPTHPDCFPPKAGDLVACQAARRAAERPADVVGPSAPDLPGRGQHKGISKSVVESGAAPALSTSQRPLSEVPAVLKT